MGVLLQIWSKIWGATPLKFADPTPPPLPPQFLSIFGQLSTLPVHCSRTDQDIVNLKTDY